MRFLIRGRPKFSRSIGCRRETIGGISRANLAGVVHLERKDGTLACGFQRQSQDSLRVCFEFWMERTHCLMSEKISRRNTLWKKDLPVPDPARKLRFELRDRDGAVLLAQVEGEYDWTPESEIKVGPQTSYAFPQESDRTVDDWLQLGITAELNGELLAAVNYYQKALRKFPSSLELQKASGRILAGLQRYQEAAGTLAAAHDRNTTDSETSYYLGISYEGLGRERDAVDAYQEAMRLPTYRAAAALRLGELRARQGALQEAENFLTISLHLRPNDLRAAEELTAVIRAMGRPIAPTNLRRSGSRDFH